MPRSCVRRSTTTAPSPTPTTAQRVTTAAESPGASYAYVYDDAGNRTGMWVGGTRTITQTFNAANQVDGLTYDAAGNLTNDGTTTYTYDALNRMTLRSTTPYTYNGDGALVQDATTRYTQDLASPLSQVLQTTQGSATTNYLYGMDRLAAVAGSTHTWYGYDALGSVRQTLSDTGAPLGVVTYDPWGTIETGSAPTFGFTGELQDAATGLVNLRARWYSTGQGTFTSRDPFAGMSETPYSQHPYQYGYSDPVRNTDPTGRQTAGDLCMSMQTIPNCVVAVGSLPAAVATCIASGVCIVVAAGVVIVVGSGALIACAVGLICEPYTDRAYQPGAPVPVPGPTLPAPGTLTPPATATPMPVPATGGGAVVAPTPIPSSRLIPGTVAGTDCATQTQQRQPQRNVVELGPGITIVNLEALAARFPDAQIYGIDNVNALALEFQLELSPNKDRIHVLDANYASFQGPFLQRQASVVVAVAPNPRAPIFRGIQNFAQPGGQVLVVTDQDLVKQDLQAALGIRAQVRRVRSIRGPGDFRVVPMTSIGIPLISQFYTLADNDEPWEIYVPFW